jgi:hypothetical protein
MMDKDGDNLVDLCKYILNTKHTFYCKGVFRWSFDMGVRGAGGTGGSNATIVDMARVECPAELVEMTQIKRSDDPNTFDI